MRVLSYHLRSLVTMLQKPHGENMWREKALRLQGEREGGESPAIPASQSSLQMVQLQHLDNIWANQEKPQARPVEPRTVRQ